MSLPTEAEVYAQLPSSIKYDPEIGFGYDPVSGRLWRIHEMDTVTVREYDGRIVARKLNCKGNIAKIVTHIMWKIMTGVWPNLLIDHEDGDVANNKWVNLREATHSQNAANKNSPGRWNNVNEGMELGVYKTHNRYEISIGRIYYGSFDNLEEANNFAKLKRQELYGNFVRRAV